MNKTKKKTGNHHQSLAFMQLLYYSLIQVCYIKNFYLKFRNIINITVLITGHMTKFLLIFRNNSR